jgi:endonuclease VIII
VPEGDTIASAAHRIRPLLHGRVPDEIRTPHPRHRHDRWPERLAGRAVTSVDTHGKHLFLRFEGDLVIPSHLGMSGAWDVYPDGRPWARSPSRAWLVLRAGSSEVVEFDGPLLELLTESRTRFDQRLAALGPDVLAPEFDTQRFRVRWDAAVPRSATPAGSSHW